MWGMVLINGFTQSPRLLLVLNMPKHQSPGGFILPVKCNGLITNRKTNPPAPKLPQEDCVFIDGQQVAFHGLCIVLKIVYQIKVFY